MNDNQTNENSWTVEVQEDDNTKELYLELPSDLLTQMNWKEGDTLTWEELPDGKFSLRKEK